MLSPGTFGSGKWWLRGVMLLVASWSGIDNLIQVDACDHAAIGGLI